MLGGTDGVVTAEDVIQGVPTTVVELKVVLIIGLEMKGAVILLETIEVIMVLKVVDWRVCFRVAGVVWDLAPGVVTLPIAVRVAVVNAVGVPVARTDLIFGFSFRGRGVETAMQEFPGGGQAMMGLEALEIALHDVHQKADGGAAIVGFVADESGQIGMVLRQVHGGRSNWREVPAGTGTTDLGSISGDAGMGWGPTEVEELTGSVEAVAGLGVFEVALHEVDEEADDQPAVVGLLADDVGEGLGSVDGRFDGLGIGGLGIGCEHLF